MAVQLENNMNVPTTLRVESSFEPRRRGPLAMTIKLLSISVLMAFLAPFVYSFFYVHNNSSSSSSSSSGAVHLIHNNNHNNRVLQSSSSLLSCELAKQQSFGFFTDIPDAHWQRLQQTARSETLFERPLPQAEQGSESGALWMMNNVDPIFTCWHMRRIGGRGEGGKWVCDPHRLLEKKDCLVYSIGSQGHYRFEDGLIEFLGGTHCEIHVFDPDPSFARKRDAEKKNIHYHDIGIKSSYRESPTFGENKFVFRDILTIVRDLHHTGRRIDLFKINCEGCEWTTYQDWLSEKLDIRQIIMETHISTQRQDVPASGFFQALVDRGFLPFSKEANTHPAARPTGTLFEYGFVRLHPSFLKSTPSGENNNNSTNSSSSAGGVTKRV